MTSSTADIDALDPVPETLRLSTGTFVSIVPLKTRQFFKLIRILTHGAGPMLMDLDLSVNMPTEEFTGKLLGLVLLSVPDAEDESIEFLYSMVTPVGLIEGRKLSKGDAERNAALWEPVNRDLSNPELEDTISILEAIVKREAKDIQRLGKRLATMFELADKTGQLKSSRPSSTPSTQTDSSEDSPEHSTSSPQSTDGQTRELETAQLPG